MFIHWGVYSLLGRGEWVMFFERIPVREYAKLAEHFNPANFNADAWVQLAKEAGMKYMVMTARHHDGFCMFNSKVSDFTSVKTRAKRDFIAEYVRACRKAGLKVGIYYSLMDWRFPGYFNYKTDKESAEAMRRQCHEQVRELMTNYGKIDILWYDGLWLGHDASTDKRVSPRFWKSKELNAMARKLQPHIIINNRSGLKEDFDTPEGHVKASKKGRAWEACMTTGSGWGYVKHDPNMKTTTQLLQNLVLAAAGEGNFLLNVGPRPDGTIREDEATRLREMGRWLRANGEAIYGSQRATGLLSDYGWTRKGEDYYFSIFNWPGKELVLPLMKSDVRSATILATGQKAKIRRGSNGRVILYDLPENPPDEFISTIRFRFAGNPQLIEEANPAAWLEGTK